MTTHRRSRAREIALQALYRLDLNAATTPDETLRFVASRLRDDALVDFATRLVNGVGDHRGEIDALLDARAHHWRVARMAATDRAILRIAVFEMLHTDAPGPVVASEAIDLAKRYGGEASPAFVAGVLGGLLADRATTTG